MDTLKKPYCIGLTGGIGAGKTTVSDFFKKLGVPIIDADCIAHTLTEKETDTYKEIVAHFGKKILQPDHSLNRQMLRDIIFDLPAEKKWLENLLHPLIRKTIRENAAKIKAPYCICVIPLLTESSHYDFLNRILVVDTPLDIQLLRAKNRDNMDNRLAKKIMDAQATQEARLAMADDIIINTGHFATLEDQVKKLHAEYVIYANTR